MFRFPGTVLLVNNIIGNVFREIDVNVFGVIEIDVDSFGRLSKPFLTTSTHSFVPIISFKNLRCISGIPRMYREF